MVMMTPDIKVGGDRNGWRMADGGVEMIVAAAGVWWRETSDLTEGKED